MEQKLEHFRQQIQFSQMSLGIISTIKIFVSYFLAIKLPGDLNLTSKRNKLIILCYIYIS